jgi:hypothetical protein
VQNVRSIEITPSANFSNRVTNRPQGKSEEADRTSPRPPDGFIFRRVSRGRILCVTEYLVNHEGRLMCTVSRMESKKEEMPVGKGAEGSGPPSAGHLLEGVSRNLALRLGKGAFVQADEVAIIKSRRPNRNSCLKSSTGMRRRMLGSATPLIAQIVETMRPQSQV